MSRGLGDVYKRQVLFLSDHEGDEAWGIYRADLADRTVVSLTVGEPANLDPPFVPRDLPQTMFYAGRSFDDPATTIWEAATELPGPARAVYETTAPASSTT